MARWSPPFQISAPFSSSSCWSGSCGGRDRLSRPAPAGAPQGDRARAPLAMEPGLPAEAPAARCYAVLGRGPRGGDPPDDPGAPRIRGNRQRGLRALGRGMPRSRGCSRPNRADRAWQVTVELRRGGPPAGGGPKRAPQSARGKEPLRRGPRRSSASCRETGEPRSIRCPAVEASDAEKRVMEPRGDPRCPPAPTSNPQTEVGRSSWMTSASIDQEVFNLEPFGGRELGCAFSDAVPGRRGSSENRLLEEFQTRYPPPGSGGSGLRDHRARAGRRGSSTRTKRGRTPGRRGTSRTDVGR